MRSNFFMVSVILLLWAYQSFSQTQTSLAEPDTTLAKQYITMANEFAKDGKFDSTITYFNKVGIIYQKACEQCNQQKVWEQYLYVKRRIGYYTSRLGKYDDAYDILDKALKLGLKHLGEKHKLIAEIYNSIGIVCYKKNEFKKSKTIIQNH